MPPFLFKAQIARYLGPRQAVHDIRNKSALLYHVPKLEIFT